MKCGFYEMDITPSIGSGISAGFWPTKTVSIKDHLYAHAFAASSNGKTIVIVSLDIAVVEKEDADRIRSGISEAVGISKEAVSVCAIHVHIGPIAMDLYQCYKDHAYCSFMAGRAIDAGIMAVQKMKEARIGAGACNVEDVAFNRRYRLKNGQVVMNPGLQNPEIDCAVDVADPQLQVLRVDHIDGRPMGIIANYALHCDTVRGEKAATSADYPGVIRSGLRKTYGEEIGFVFLPGTSGNVNHLDVSKPKEEQKDHFSIGKILCDEIISLCSNIETVETEQLSYVSRDFVGRTKHPTQRDCEKISDENIRREMMRVADLPETDESIEVWAARLGDYVINMVPGEPFAYFGMEIKRRSPFKYTFTCELSNTCIGYIYTKEGELQGGYEATPSTYVRMNSDVGYQIVDTSVECIEQLNVE